MPIYIDYVSTNVLFYSALNFIKCKVNVNILTNFDHTPHEKVLHRN